MSNDKAFGERLSIAYEEEEGSVWNIRDEAKFPFTEILIWSANYEMHEKTVHSNRATRF